MAHAFDLYNVLIVPRESPIQDVAALIAAAPKAPALPAAAPKPAAKPAAHSNADDDWTTF
ncbi:hypothetical protein C8239_00650 [Paracidovorax avenae]|nr:hypothetical protein C8239_00650 [Paracidovorax avenae]